jgi:hypothetical protein
MTFSNEAKMQESDLTTEDLSDLFTYDNATGNLFWKNPYTNAVRLGEPAGTITAGYCNVKVFCKSFQAHRLIWIMFNGQIPEGLVVDHRDTNSLNNRIENLRLATRSQNRYNSKKITGLSKYRGVAWFKPSQCWQAQIQVDGKKIVLGYFGDELKASEAYEEAAKEIHGDFYREPEVK